MGDNIKKHSRKSKLVERTYEDIEDTCEVKYKPTKPLKTKKTVPKPPEDVKPPIELSVQIETEDADDDWYKTMLEQEMLEKLGTPKKKRNTVKAKILNERDLFKLTLGQGIICIDSSFEVNKYTAFYKYVLVVETLLLSPYTAYYGPIYYKELQYKRNRCHMVYSYYCMPCKLKCTSRYYFMCHLSTHNVINQLYYTVTKVNELPTLICTTQPIRYINDGIVADIGIGNLISIVHDYETAIKYVITKWHRSEKEEYVLNGILCYKCYSCSFVCEYHSQFVSHLNEKHDSVKVLITTEELPDKFMSVVASSKFKPDFQDLTQIPNQLKYKCFKCKKIFHTYETYRNHCKRINVCAGCGIELPCNQMSLHEGQCNKFLTVFYPKMCPCKRLFVSSKEMTEHQVKSCKFGRTALVFNCLVCNYLSPSMLKLLIHQRLEHYVRSDLISVAFKVSLCHICGEKYVDSYSRHYCKNRQDIVDCTSCGMLFQNEYFLHIHAKGHPSAVCSSCNENFEFSCGLIEHRIKKHGYQDIEIKYKCTICNALLNMPDPEGVNLSVEHKLDLHKTNKVFIFNYKKVYMAKAFHGTYGYHTDIFPTMDSITEQNTDDLEDFIDAVVIKKSNILSKSSCSNATSKSKKRLVNLNGLVDNYEHLSNTISQEHNYDLTQSSAIDDGSYDIDRVSTSLIDAGMNTKIILQEKAKHSENGTQRTIKSRNRNNMEVTINDSNEGYNECKIELDIDATQVKEEMIGETDIKDNGQANNIIIDSFSDIHEDMIKCEPDAETILVKTHVPVTVMPRNDEAKAGCSKDVDYSIKSEAMSDDESDLIGFNYNNGSDNPLSPKDPEEIGFAPQNKVISNLLFETKEKKDETVDDTKAVKRKLTDATTRVPKSKPNPDTPDVLTEANEFVTEKDITKEGSQDTVDEESSAPLKQNLETQEKPQPQPVKKSSKPKKRRKRFEPLRRKPKSSKKFSEPFRGFEKQEVISESHQIVKKIGQKVTENSKSADCSENAETVTESTDTLQDLGESSTADTASFKSEKIDNKTEDDGKVSVKLEIKEELIEEYETDLIIFDDANSSNESATDEKFVEINYKSNLDECLYKPKIYFCKKCQFTGHHKGYKEHLNLCRKDLPKRVSLHMLSNKKNQLLTYNCIKCNLECDDLRDYLKHLPVHGYDDIHCPCCHEGFQTFNMLAEHVLRHIKADFKRICFLQLNNKPMELKKFRCCNCKMIVDQEDFFGHWQVHFDRVVVKKQPRDLRTAVMRAEYGDLAKSMALETGVKREICDTLQETVPGRKCLLCRKQFTRLHDIKRHLIEHLTMDALCNRPSVKSMKCQICQEEFDYTDLYKRHMRDHAALPLYQCQICDKSFSDSSNFGKHKKVHDVFEFICDICRRKFQSKSSLVAHMSLHEKHKVITCEFCLKKFYFPSTYKKHIRSAHEKGIPKHSCTLCRTRFVSVKEQLNHEWREHGLRKTPVDCPLCDQGYRRVIDLKNHLKGTHSLPYFCAKNRPRIEELLKSHGLSQDKINLVFSTLNTAKISNG